MIILTIRTDNPRAEIGLYSDTTQLGYVTWEAHRMLAETLHSKIGQILTDHQKDWTDVTGIVCYSGPGSFTGLRIGSSVANALAASLPAAIVATNNGDSDSESDGALIGHKSDRHADAWIGHGLQQLLDGQDAHQITPLYGAPVHITLPRK